MGQPSVLVVDDEPGNLATFVRYFRRELVITPSGSGPDALARVRAGDQTFDLLVVDQSMPELSGVAVLTILAREAPEIGRIICTGYPEHPEVTEAHRAGIVDVVIMKPWDGPDVLRVIHDLVHARRARSGQAPEIERNDD